MGVENESVPLLTWRELALGASIRKLLRAMTTKGIGSRVARVVKDRHDLAQLQWSPDHFALVSTRTHAPREQKVVVTKMLDRLARGAGANKGLKQQAHRLLHLEVWIEHDLSVDIINEAGGQVSAKLTAARLVQKTTSQSGSHDVQLGFTHGAL